MQDTTLTTALYYNETARNWYKLDKVGNVKIGSLLKSPASYIGQMLVAKGGDSSAACLASPDSTNCKTSDLKVKANNREYFSKGYQFIFKTLFETGSVSHEIEIGFRDHEDEMDRYQFADYYYIQGGTPKIYKSRYTWIRF